MINAKIFPLTNTCLQFIQNITSSPLSLFFRKPYKPQKDDDYFEIIKKPMDLSTVKKKLLNGEYISIKQWESEVRLIFTNSILYNGETHLLGGISLYFLKKLDKFMENVENFNSRNFEEKTKKLYSEVIKLLREMPAVDIQCMDCHSNDEIINQGQQSGEIQNGISQIQSEQVIQGNDTSQIQSEESTATTKTQIQNEEIQNHEKIQNQNEVIQNEEKQTDNGDVQPEENYPFKSLEFQSYGEFDKPRMRKIKNDLNNLVPSHLKEIINIIHDTDADFRFSDIKEIDVASMSRRTLIAIEDIVQNIENGKFNKKIDNDTINQKPQLSFQNFIVRPTNRNYEVKMSSNSEVKKENGSGKINISIDINPKTMNDENNEISSIGKIAKNNVENAVNNSIANDANKVHVVINNSNQTAYVSNAVENTVNNSMKNDASEVHVVINNSSQAAGANNADNSVTKDESGIQKVENSGN